MSKEENPAFVVHPDKTLHHESRPLPKLSDPSDVLVQISYTGICGSDVHYWQHGRIGNFVVSAPMVLGHESSGVVQEVGSDVTYLKPGDHVALEPGIPCRRCNRCKAGTYNLCPHVEFAATPPFDGTLCRTYRAPADFCYKLPKGVTLQEGALMEPLTVAVHIVRQANVAQGQSVVVFGAGPVGLLCLAVAKAFGASKIVTVDVNETRVKFAEDYAATNAFRPRREESPEESAQRLVQECDLGDGPDVAIDASGAEVCMQTAIHALRTGGTYVQGGMGKSDVNWPIMAMCTKELVVKGSFRYGPGDYELSIGMVASGRIDVKKLISQEVKFVDAANAFEKTKKAAGIKILIKGPEE